MCSISPPSSLRITLTFLLLFSFRRRLISLKMISSSSLPPYNRFDTVPQHALQCGLAPEVDYIPSTAHQRSATDTKSRADDSSHDFISSRESSESYVTGGSQSTGSSQRDPSSISSLDSLLSPTDSVTRQLNENLYIEPTSPPPYNKPAQVTSLSDGAPSRNELPKKSQAAQQRAAEISLQTGKGLKPFGKHQIYNQI